jgi:FkbM family methyltransferase
MRQICELGSNVGVALAGLAHGYPGARVLGVEPDPANAALARANTAAFEGRCTVIEAAIWDHEADLVVEGDRADALTVRELRESDPPEIATVRGRTVESILAEHMPEGPIDYVHVNVEGTERLILTPGAAWPERVQSIKVEVYPQHGFGTDDCLQALERLGFDAWLEPEWWGGYGLGIRR